MKDSGFLSHSKKHAINNPSNQPISRKSLAFTTSIQCKFFRAFSGRAVVGEEIDPVLRYEFHLTEAKIAGANTELVKIRGIDAQQKNFMLARVCAIKLPNSQ